MARPQTKWICNSRGHLDLDMIIKFADINAEYTKLAHDLDLPVKTLPRHLATPPASYIEAYDSALREKVGRIYQDEIRLLNFKFEDEI